MANPADSEEFDPTEQRKTRVYLHGDGYAYRMGEKRRRHLAQSSAAQLAICMAADSAPDLLEDRMRDREIDLDTDLSELLTEEERRFFPAATYIVEGLHEIDRIDSRDSFKSAKNAIAVDRMGTAP